MPNDDVGIAKLLGSKKDETLLERLEALLAGVEGARPTISADVIRRSQVSTIGSRYSGVVARAFCWR